VIAWSGCNGRDGSRNCNLEKVGGCLDGGRERVVTLSIAKGELLQESEPQGQPAGLLKFRRLAQPPGPLKFIR